MIPVKIQCGCGQRYAFDVEPVNGLMPMPVACPVCGVDGTAAANVLIAQVLAARPAIVAAAAPPLRPPPLPPAATQPSPKRPNPPPAARGKDGWATEESQLNKLGTYVTVTPAILAAMLSSGFMGLQVPATILFIIVGVAGLVGGVLNIAGRGPMVAGAIIGLLIALGGYGAMWWWMQDRESVRKFEVIIAFAVGTVPGFLLQYILQQILRKRSA